MGEDDLEEKCLQVSDESTKDAFNSETFTTITFERLEKIVKRDTLNVEEIDIYRACVCWAEAECNRQNLQVTFV